MKKKMYRSWTIYLTTVFCSLLPVVSRSEDESWRQSLSVKERLLEANIQKRHNILGLYPSMVEVPPDGAAVDITTATPFSDIAHAVCWTSNYLAGASYRYRFLKESGASADVVETARLRADELFEAVYRCQRVTGVRGLQARGYLLGHGPVYEERGNSKKADEWHQGEVDGQIFRWRGDPSHHNYSDSVHGLGQYYDLAAEGKQKDRARDAIDALVSYWVDNDLMIHKLDRTRRPVPILGFANGTRLNTRVMMVIAGAKVAYHATGKEKFRQTYERLIRQYDVRKLKTFPTGKEFDDAEHVLCHLDTLFRIEKDRELLAAYGIVADGIWETHKTDAQSLFTYIYYRIRPDAPGRDEALKQAHRSLQTWPTAMTIHPRMNSLFPDRKAPFPVHQAAYDNEYIWKGNLLRPDGWQSRIVTDVTVSAEDPEVIAAIDTNGEMYLSRDGAQTGSGWRPIDQRLKSPVRSVAFGSRSRIMAVACDDGFYTSTTGAESWQRLPVPSNGAKPIQVLFDTNSPFSLLAVTTGGIYRSRDFGEEFLGQSWQALADDLPRSTSFRFFVASGEPTQLYARTRDRFFTRSLDESDWKLGESIGLGEYSKSLRLFAIDPTRPNHLYAGAATLGGPFPVHTIIQESTNRGESWTNGMALVFRLFADGKLMEFLRTMPAGELRQLAVDPHDPTILYAAGPELGILKSSDGGKSWSLRKKGFDIPRIETVMVPKHGHRIFCGTPAGLFVSNDQGETWRNGHLVLQFTRNRRRELGGAAFIDAYWRARYFGFIDDELANRSTDE